MIRPFQAVSFLLVGFIILRIGLRPSALPGIASTFYGKWQRLWGLVAPGATVIAATLVAYFVQ
jgi:hypothetical protein